MAHKKSHESKSKTYEDLLAKGLLLLGSSLNVPDDIGILIDEYRLRMRTGEQISIEDFCKVRHISPKEFEAFLYPTEGDAQVKIPKNILAYYNRPEVHLAFYRWAEGRELAMHYSIGTIRTGFRKPFDIYPLALAGYAQSASFHASVGRYTYDGLFAFDLVAELDYKDDWRACFRATRPFLEVLHRDNVSFMVKYSGHSSAHVIVPCKGSNYREAAALFLKKMPESFRNNSKLDLTFKDPKHFLRMPYAIHEDTGLVSLPLTLEEFDSFHPEKAKPENVVVHPEILDNLLFADNVPWLLNRK